jgi:hypothetical protein
VLPEFEQFAADRSARLNDFDKEIRPIVERAMDRYAQGDSTWYEDVVQSAGVLWSETFDKTSPTGKPGDALTTFLRELTDSLKKTSKPSDPPTTGEIDRVTNWIGVYAVNSATLFGSRDAGHPVKHWVTMHDDHVRSTHRAVDGQTADILGTFDVGGYKLQFPGEPVGPPEIWINCRCLLTATGGPQMGTKTQGFAVNTTEGASPDATSEESDNAFVDSETETPWHGVLVVEGTPTGDKRQFDNGALTFGNLPMPISYQRASSDGHGGSVVVGRIDTMERVGNEIRGTGAFNLNTPEAHEVIDGIIFGSHGGFSVDVDSTEFELEFPEEMSEDGEGLEVLFGGGVQPLQHFTAGRIRGGSILALPAFQEAYIALGPDFDEDVRDPQAGVDAAQGEDVDTEYEILDEIEMSEEMAQAFAKLLSGMFDDAEDMDQSYALVASASFAPGTHDGPGWLKNPADTERLRRYWTKGKGAAKIRWGVPGDFNRCRMHLGKYINPAFLAGTCANLHKVAIGIWPGQEDGGRHRHHAGEAETFALVAGGDFEIDTIPHEFFENPQLTAITPLTVTDDGHVFGHLAAWGTCHLGIGERCVMPPSSPSNYSYYTRGIVGTDQGPVRTGPLVMWTGHAGTRLSAYKATKHYDNTGAAVADLAVGEDALGIWFSGKLRDDVSQEDIRTLRASAVSGDWRDPERRGTPDEMVGLIAVNNPGFPIPRVAFAMDGDKQISLIASGGLVLPRKEPFVSANIGTFRLSAEDIAAIQSGTADELERRAQRREKISAARDQEIIEEADGRRAKKIAAAKELEDA